MSSVQKSSEFMLQMIDDLLDISSIEAGMLRLDRRPSDPHKLLEHNVGLNAGLAQQKHVHVSLQIEGALPRLSLDEWKIAQVLNNLISNAVKYSQPGTAVEVRAVAEDSGVRISVRDQGPGIAEAERGKLFQPFGRTSVSSTDGEGGTGLAWPSPGESWKDTAGASGWKARPASAPCFSLRPSIGGDEPCPDSPCNPKSLRSLLFR